MTRPSRFAASSCCSHRDGGTFEAPIPISALKLSGVGGPAVASIQGAASSRTNAGNWVSMVGKEPLREWTLQLPDSQHTPALFDDGVIDDILLVVGFAGDTPAWV